MKKLTLLLIFVLVLSSFAFGEEGTRTEEYIALVLENSIELQINALELALDEELLEEALEVRDERNYFAGNRTDLVQQKKAYYVDVLTAENKVERTKYSKWTTEQHLIKDLAYLMIDIEVKRAELELAKEEGSLLQEKIDLMEIRYKNGQVKYTTLQQAERDLLSQELSRQSLQNNLVSLEEDFYNLLGDDREVLVAHVKDPEEYILTLEEIRNNSLEYMAAKDAYEEEKLQLEIVGEHFNSGEAEYDKALQAFKKAEIALTTEELSSQMTYRKFLRNLSNQEQEMKLSDGKLSLEKSLTSEVKLRFDLGLMTELDVMEAKLAQEKAIFDQVKATSDHKKLLIDYYLLKGIDLGQVLIFQ